ncbi:MAG: Alternative complex III, subunit ActDE [Ignavibacteriae bacterium]|nr:MAG: Alternative complex III, subunit ActDE [Ignavibacteriota bacterium]
MNSNIFLTASFSDVNKLINAIKYLNSEHIKFSLYSPVPNHEIEKALNLKSSKVGWFTLTGAIIGLVTGFGLAIYTSAQWNLTLGGKPPVTLIPFLVIGFEFTILFGALATLLGLIIKGKFPSYKKFPGYKPDFTIDKFGISIEIKENEVNSLKEKLSSLGAKDIYYE